MNEADLYAKYNSLQKNDAIYVLENYFRLITFRIERDENVLDIGCGDGEVTVDLLFPLLPKKIAKLVGFDVSENMVEHANKFYQNPKISFVKMDIESAQMPIEMEEQFHHAFSFYCLHWVQNQTQAIKNIYNLLKPGGDMLLSFLANNPIFTVYKKLQNNQKWESYMTDAKNFMSPYQNAENPEKDFESLLRKTGFSVHFCQVVDRIFVFNNMDVLRKSICAVNPFFKRIPETKQNDYLEDFIAEIRKMKLIESNNNNNEEKVNTPYKLFVVFASKQNV